MTNLKELSLAQLEDIYFKNMKDLETDKQLQEIEDLIMEKQANKPIIENLYKLYDGLRFGYVEITSEASKVYADILKVEELYYEDFIHYMALKHYNNKDHMMKEFDKYLDDLVKRNEICAFTRIGLEYNIQPID